MKTIGTDKLIAELEAAIAPLEALKAEYEQRVERAIQLLKESQALRNAAGAKEGWTPTREHGVWQANGGRNGWPQFQRDARQRAIAAIRHWCEENGLGEEVEP